MKIQLLTAAVALFMGTADAKLRPKVMKIRSGQTQQDMREVLESKDGVDYSLIESTQPIIENSHERKVRSPMVQSHGSYNQYCVFDDDQNNWCLISTGAMMTVGWEVVQFTTPARSGTGTDIGSFTIAFKPYIKSAIALVSKIVMELLFNKEDTLQYAEFTVKVFYQMLFVTSGQICFGYGYEYTPIELIIQTQYHANDCYKTIIQDLCKWDEAFLGKEAKWIDDCSQSNEVNNIVFIDWQIQEGSKTVPLLGGAVQDGKGCWSFADWTYWAPHVAKYAADFIPADTKIHAETDEQLDAVTREMLSWAGL